MFLYSRMYMVTQRRETRRTYVLADIGEHLDAGKRAKETFDVIFEDAGGMKHVSSPLELPRNTKQIYNVKQTQKSAVAGKDRDSMFQLIKACKDQQSLADPYIRVVQCAPEFCCICSSDLQLMEMDMFLTNPSECTIMGIDPTFNLGEFVVTPIVYKNLKLIHRRTGECPTFLGPVLIHQTKTNVSNMHIINNTQRSSYRFRHHKTLTLI
ncbi:unnamed protein product [Mytilus edulis]|uniref:Uncharacterized protein n=1 Tax=Mytilus edulis TaxID=6550 RepID=A0A8S3PY95_MYTED|nr:unnamed protein product [Mytilus edulis]